MNDDLREGGLTAIAVMTAALESPGQAAMLASQVANSYVSEHPDDGHSRLLNGFVNLCTFLLTHITGAAGKTAEEALREIAEHLPATTNLKCLTFPSRSDQTVPCETS